MNLTRVFSNCLLQHRNPTVMLSKCLSTAIFSTSVTKISQFLGIKMKSLSPCTSLSSRLLVPNSIQTTPARTYMAKNALRLRCSGCYFEKRQGRLYVECTLKPRHRQFKKLPSSKIFKDDYSKGKIETACWWKYRTDRWYRQGHNPQYTQFNWLGDKLGKEI